MLPRENWSPKSPKKNRRQPRGRSSCCACMEGSHLRFAGHSCEQTSILFSGNEDRFRIPPWAGGLTAPRRRHAACRPSRFRRQICSTPACRTFNFATKEVACSVCIDHSGQASTAKAAQAAHCPTVNGPNAFATTGMAKAMIKLSSGFFFSLDLLPRSAGAASRPRAFLGISTPDSSGGCFPRRCSEIWKGAHTRSQGPCPDENAASR